jgi:hypothetical protein
LTGGQVVFFVSLDAPEPNTLPPPPSIIAKVDGKVVRALGVDRKPLPSAELKNRLPTWTAVVVVPADLDLPDPYFMSDQTLQHLFAAREKIYPRVTIGPQEQDQEIGWDPSAVHESPPRKHGERTTQRTPTEHR